MTAQASNAVHPAAASIAAAMRSRLGNRPVKAPPRADGALLRLAGLIVTLVMAGTAAAWWGIEIVPGPGSTSVIARVGPVVMAVPRVLSGPVPEDGQQVVGLVRLRLSWPNLGPVAQDARQVIHVTAMPPDRMNDPSTQLAMMARFLTPIAWSNPGGLVARSFRAGSPFETEELFISQPDGQAFSARCPSQTTPDALDELCRTTLRHRGIDLAIRFPRDVLPEWQKLTSGVRQQIDTMLR
jgi:hypothetical protein